MSQVPACGCERNISEVGLSVTAGLSQHAACEATGAQVWSFGTGDALLSVHAIYMHHMWATTLPLERVTSSLRSCSVTYEPFEDAEVPTSRSISPPLAEVRTPRFACSSGAFCNGFPPVVQYSYVVGGWQQSAAEPGAPLTCAGERSSERREEKQRTNACRGWKTRPWQTGTTEVICIVVLN